MILRIIFFCARFVWGLPIKLIVRMKCKLQLLRERRSHLPNRHPWPQAYQTISACLRYLLWRGKMKQSRQQNVRGIIHYMRIQGAISSKTRTTFRLASTVDFLYSFCSFSRIIELGATGILVSRGRLSQSDHVGYTHVHTCV